MVPNQGSNDKLGQSLRELARDEPDLLLRGREYEIFSHATIEKTDVGAFQQAFGKIFTDYRKKLIANATKQLEADGEKVLTTEEFTKQEGPKPWDFVNNILEVSSLDFRINHPRLDEPFGSFEPRLTKVSSAVEMKFGDLSSGERVLMSFALCLYNSSENRGTSIFPKLLLLDEIDAPLHPDMVKFVLKTIKEVLVEKHHISVIATTHSPTTVALFEDQDIFEMDANGPVLSSVSKERALSILTEGVPTVSISYDLRNQVFVESETDAVVLSELYQILKSSLESVRSVQFIKSGRKSENGNEENAGCARVKSVVADLRCAGVSTVFGLVDWDGQNSSDDGILVMCEGTRYSIENLMLDPVLLIAALAKEFTDFAKRYEILDQKDTFIELVNWDEARWQVSIDQLMNLVGFQDLESTSVEYVNGMKLSFARCYLEMRGHDLATLICKKIKPLDGKRKQGKLEHFMAKNIVPELREIIPCDMQILFEKLTALTPHQN